MDQAHDQITKLLTSEWLVSDVEEGSGGEFPLIAATTADLPVPLQPINDEESSSAFGRYTSPNLSSGCTSCYSHRVFNSPSTHTFLFPCLWCFRPDSLSFRNLKRALELANVVADSRYKLYDDFINEDGRRLGDYLGAVRQAILGGLEGGGSDPFRILST